MAPDADRPEDEKGAVPSTLREFLLYFLRLGALGFGGPIALAGHMQRDLVEERHLISRQDFVEGLALSQLAPGPLAAQLAIYLGWVRAGNFGATLVGITFVLPSFLMVLALSALYIHFQGLPWLQGVFYGIGAAVIGIIAFSAYELVTKTLSLDKVLWSILMTSALVTVWTETEVIWFFILSGIFALLMKHPPRFGSRVAALNPWLLWTLTGLHGVADAGTLWKIGVFFAEAGAFVFGSGLAIVPFLHGGVVQQLHWLTERQFLDAVAVAMITPGPVVITVSFIGYLVAGPLGALVAGLGVFLPCYLFVIIPAPHYHRFVHNVRIRAFVEGVTSAATGAIAGAAIVLGKRAIIDWPTALIALLTLVLLFSRRRIPEPVLILCAGVVGLLFKRLLGR